MYRITSSINEGFPEFQKAFAARGIKDYCNALAKGRRTVHCQVFVMNDGSIVKADDRIVTEIARQVKA